VVVGERMCQYLIEGKKKKRTVNNLNYIPDLKKKSSKYKSILTLKHTYPYFKAVILKLWLLNFR
jgi:hypothetical protein